MSEPTRWAQDSRAPDQVRRWLEEPGSVDPPPRSRQRGWERLQSEPEAAVRSRRFRPLGFGFAAAAAAAVIAVVSLPGSEPVERLQVVSVRGPVHGPQRLLVGDLLPLPMSIDTGEGQVEVATEHHDVLTLSGQARWPRTTDRIELESGRIDVVAAPRTGSESLSVVAGNWTVTVVGTRFSVLRNLDDRVRVDVDKGVVRVDGPGVHRRLLAGDRFESGKARRVHEVRHRAPEPEPETEAEPGPKPRTRPLPPQDSLKAPVVPDPVPAPPPPTAAERQRALVDEAAQEPHLEARLALLDEAAKIGPPLDEIASYRAAEALRDAGQWTRAAARYRALLDRYPSGELLQQAHRSHVDCWFRAEDLSAAGRALQEYLQAVPEAANRPETRFWQGEIHRAEGNLAEAAAAFARAAEDPAFADPALFLRALALAGMGRRDEARTQMQDYLFRFPQGRHAEAARRSRTSKKEHRK